MALSDETKADIKSLFDYGMTTLGQSGTIGSSWSTPLSRASSGRAGMSGVTEAVRCMQKLGSTLQAFNLFMADAGKGATFLGYGALSIADHYVTADMSMAKEMTTVADAFMPTPDQSAGRAADEADFEAQREAYFHPGTKGEATPQLPPTGENDGPPAEKSPQQDADEHRSKYYRSETWHPEDPKAPVETGPSYDGVPGL